MPDILTHLLVGLSAGLLVQSDKEHESLMYVVIGSVIIDIERPFTWLLSFLNYNSDILTKGFHSLLGAILLSYVAASFIDSENFSLAKRYQFLFVGTITHLLLDMMMYPWNEMGLFLLYPLRLPFSFNLFWPDFPFFPIIGLIILGVTLVIAYLKSYFERYS